MNLRTIIAAACAVAASSAMASADTVTRTYYLKPGAKVQIENTAGDITVTGGDTDQLIVKFDCDTLPEIINTDTTVLIVNKVSAVSGRTTDMTIIVPQPGIALDIANGAGDVSVNRSAGAVRIRNGVGDISLLDVAGPLQASTGTGNISASWPQALPGIAELSTGIGNIDLQLPASPSATIEATSGLGSVTDLGGATRGPNASLVYGNGDSKIRCSSGVGDIDCTGHRATGRDRPLRRIRTFPDLHRGAFHFGAGGGPMMTWPDRSARALNQSLYPGGFTALPEQCWSWGGEGYVQFHRVRLGGMGWGGVLIARSATADTQRTARYEFDMGGITMEYVLLMNPRFDFSLGGMAGSGHGKLYVSKSVRSDVTWPETAGLDKYRGAALRSSHFAGMPFVRLKFNLFGWLGLQTQAGYLYCPLDGWKTTDDRDVLGSSIDASGWTFSLATHFGLQ